MTIFRSTLLFCITFLLATAAFLFYKFSTSQIIIPHRDGFFIFDRKNETVTFCNKIACQQIPGLVYGMEGRMSGSSYGPSRYFGGSEPERQAPPSYRANPAFEQAQTAANKRDAQQPKAPHAVKKQAEETAEGNTSEEDTGASDEAAASDQGDEEATDKNPDANTSDESDDSNAEE